ncbi:HNH endonuclease family protein [Kitasatospora sp. NPDC059571]|uniref:HNH endonuclease family protein n=1 Tax=Kitasatospora sp. NPDC059571 TaxID=3346871 RepID=UPI0036CD9736
MRLRPVLAAALASLATTVLVAADPAGAAAVPGPAVHRAAGESVTTTLYEAIEALPVAAESRNGYVRTAFRHWVDADRDGCDAHKEVLIAEAVTAPEIGPKCALVGGSWWSRYDDLVFTDAGRLDVDHLVPLAEAWASGAFAWTAKEREAYANDLDEPRALIAVSAASNRAKADKDVADWLPPATAYRCTYLADWTAIKTRWHLSVDDREKTALQDLESGCPNEDLTVVLAN